MSETIDVGKQFTNVLQKAWSDDAYKTSLVNNPHNAMKEIGIDAPEDIKLAVYDQTDSSKVYLNIPSKPDFSDMELSDEQLEDVAGGELAITLAALAITAGFMGVAFGGGVAIALGTQSNDDGW